MTAEATETAECCPKFDTTPWDEKSHVWRDKQFIMQTIPQFFHIPLPGVYKKATGSMWKKAQDANAAPEIKDFLMLAYDPSPWKSEIYINVTKDVPGATNVRLSGEFLTKVFDGPYNAVPKWLKVMERFVSEKGKSVKKYYFYFTTCPKCAKKYGHNYVVAFAEVS